VAAYPKISELITAVQHEIGQVAGSGVQVYSEDRIKDKIIQCFDLVLLKYGWDSYREWFAVTLDGTTGVITTDALENVRGQEDILKVFRSGESVGVPTLPEDFNPFLVTGTTVRYWTGLPNSHAQFEKRKLQFWPKTAEGNVVIKARLYPSHNFGDDDILYLDKTMLVYGSTWMTLADEGVNKESTDKNRELFDLRFRDLTKALADQDMETGQEPPRYMNEWHVNG
jgi:hypothetical protein